MEELQGGNVVKQYTYGLDLISQRQKIGSNFVTHWYGYDGHGSVRFLTDAAGAVTDTYDYDAFGLLINRTGTTPTTRLYAGEEYDPDIDLYFLRSRYLNVDKGRFWSQDKFEGINEAPSSLHKYLYVGANPVNKIDPSGKTATTIGRLGAAANAAILATIALIRLTIVAATVCTLRLGFTYATAAIQSGGDPSTIQRDGLCSFKNNNKFIVYRGTDRKQEIETYSITGYILSDAAQQVYVETGNIALAFLEASRVHEEWIKEFGNEIFYAQAHGAFGLELEREFGRKRTFVSVTTDEQRARVFAGAGKVFRAEIPRYELVPQTLSGAGEGEYLIRYGRKGFVEIR